MPIVVVDHCSLLLQLCVGFLDGSLFCGVALNVLHIISWLADSGPPSYTDWAVTVVSEWLLLIHTEKKCAATCDFQQCGNLTSVHSDQSVQHTFKLKNSK